MVMYAKIRRMFFREHLSIGEIARRTTHMQHYQEVAKNRRWLTAEVPQTS